MAASIDLSTVTSLEAQALAIASELQLKELAVDVATRPNNVQIVPDLENQVVAITLNIPVGFSRSGATLSMAAVPYL